MVTDIKVTEIHKIETWLHTYMSMKQKYVEYKHVNRKKMPQKYIQEI